MPRTRATGDTNGSSDGPTANKTKRNETYSNDSWVRFLQIAEYEINDPYRGITRPNNVDSPWNKCREVSPGHEGDKVATVCRSSCPSLRAWTSETDVLRQREQRKRKGKKNGMQIQHSLGRRREGFTCSCDSNPFCLVSLGGAMDDFLGEAAKTLLPITSNEEFPSPPNDPVDGKGEKAKSFSVDEEHPEQGKLTQCELVNIIDSDDERSTEQMQEMVKADDIEGENDSTSHVEAMIPLDKLADVYTMALPVNENELDPNNESSIYSKGTQVQLKKLRMAANVDIGPITTYAEFLVKSDTTMTTKEYISRLKRRHDALLFSNPLRIAIPPTEDTLTLAIPPGMKNLGATCYLNTQLQCLARNTVFLEGIFSWRPNSKLDNNPMEIVLEKLQLLLARMVHGAQRSISTEELSDALGLENGEMQDPNEFARLLFERMHESFQKCASASKEHESLGTLLPSLFQGIMAYETTCLKCKRSNQRQEGFMDLNLPIVHQTAEAFTSGGQQTIEESFEAAQATDVQYCLDQYLYPEELTGENQYLCDHCKCKQDATRQVVFRELPPVLNLQLCRYVFDREKCMKKKLTDGVLLSQTLKVPARESAARSTYILCAVMKHRGNSAYQGHYVADAMDWQTGKWFEFNDDVVKILEEGPSYSVENFGKDGGKKKEKRAKASEDAYNMYYVQELFLAKSAVSSIASKVSYESQLLNGIGNENMASSALHQIASERTNLYSLLSDLCMNDGRIADCQRRRALGLRSVLSACSREAGAIDFGPKKDQDSSEMVWIEGRIIRMFLCKKSADEILSATAVSRWCEHNTGLHPRVAREGKVIPLTVYQGYITLLHTELKYASICSNLAETTAIDRSAPIFAKDVACEVCRVTYVAEIKSKLELLTMLKELHDALDPKQDSEAHDASTSDYIYAISSKFITRFRNRVNEILRGLDCPKVTMDGIDAIDMSVFLPDTVCKDVDSDDAMDITVNDPILCTYGRCCNTLNKRMVRFVSASTWLALKQIFPHGIELKKPTAQINQLVPCEECATSNLEKYKLHEWSSSLKAGLPRHLLEGKGRNDTKLISSSRDSEGRNASNEFILVHKKDMKRWRDALALVTGKGIEDVISIKGRLREMLFPNANSDTMDQEDEKNAGRFGLLAQWQPIPLICLVHQKCLFDVMFDDSIEGETGVHRLNTSIEVLSRQDYLRFVKSMCDMHTIITCSEEQRSDNDMLDRLETLLQRLCERFHPCLSFFHAVDMHADEAVFVKHGTDGKCSSMKLCPKKCAAHCKSDLRESSKLFKKVERNRSVLESEEVMVVDVNLPSEVNQNVEISLKVVAVKAATNIDNAIATICGLADILNDGTSSTHFPRRSGRKRKQRYSNGEVEAEDIIAVRPAHNFAGLRLLMYEKCPSFRVDDQIFLLFPYLIETPTRVVIHESNDNVQLGETCTNPLNLFVPYEWNTKSLLEAIEIAVQGRTISASEKMDMMKDLILIRKSSNDVDKPNGVKGTKNVPHTSNDTLMESLLEVANFSDSSPQGKGTDGRNKSVRRPERGFRGTLLSNANHVEAESTIVAKDTCSSERDRSMATVNAAIMDPVSENSETNVVDSTMDLSDTNDDGCIVDSEQGKSSKPRVSVLDMAGEASFVLNDDFSECQSDASVTLNTEEVMEAVLTSLMECGMEIDIDKMNDSITMACLENPNASLRDVADAAIARCMH